MADWDREVGSSSSFLQRWRNITGSVYAKCVALADLIAGEDLTNGALTIRQLNGWTINHVPAAATKATIAKAAGATGVKHVCTSITATYGGLAGTTAAAGTITLYDGASGGTVLWSTQVVFPVGGTAVVVVPNLWIVGSAATAMTLEFAAAGAANTYQAVSATGVDIQ